MFLSSLQYSELDAVCARFEVAIRSYVADVLLKTIGEAETVPRLRQMVSVKTSTMHSHRYSGKAGALANSKTLTLLKNAQASLAAGAVVEGDVLTLGQVLDLIYLFYNDAFKGVDGGAASTQQFDARLANFNAIRGALAHPGSVRVTRAQAEEAMDLFKGLESQIPDEYYWYCSKGEIRGLMAAFTSHLNNTQTIRHNLGTVSRRHSRLLMRSDELKKIQDLVFGSSPFGRTSDSIEIYGWGGVGKTALALEFCYEVLRLQANDPNYGYDFVLWLSSKSEELTYNPVTGDLQTRPLESQYTRTDDVLLRLKDLLSVERDLPNEQFLCRLANGGKGLIVLDNLENIEDTERRQISDLIRSLPRNIKVVLTSRNYEGVADASLNIDGFEDDRGKQFAREFCETKGFSVPLDDKELTSFVKASCGNTLILVLGLDRLIEGKATLQTLVDELVGTRQADMETLASFMYKHTLESVLREISESALQVDVPSLLTTLVLYGEIDFHSLRELLNIDDAKALETVLERLESTFVINCEQGYYRIHEFAAKFVVLQLVPDRVRLKELADRVSDYRTRAQRDLDAFYSDKESVKLRPILEDWGVETGGDTLAFAQTFNEYSRIKDGISVGKDVQELVKSVNDRFAQIERRSYHPYIRFQKARVLEALRSGLVRADSERLGLEDEIERAYEDAYLMVNLKHRRVAGTESYPVFLWFYGMHLTRRRKTGHAIRVLEEAVACFRHLPSLRRAENAARCCLQLAYVMSLAYIESPREGYLDRIKSMVYQSSAFFDTCKEAPSEDDQKSIQALLLFVDIVLLSLPRSTVVKRIQGLGVYPKHLSPIIRYVRAHI